MGDPKPPLPFYRKNPANPVAEKRLRTKYASLLKPGHIKHNALTLAARKERASWPQPTHDEINRGAAQFRAYVRRLASAH